MNRYLALKNSEIKPKEITEAGGVKLRGKASVKTMTIGDNLMLVKLHIPKGFFHPPHKHPSHESTGYVVNGKIKMTIAERDYILEEGSAWLHPMNVEHSTEALEDTVCIEIHCPPREEYRYDK